jgi:hypothetical protein
MQLIGALHSGREAKGGDGEQHGCLEPTWKLNPWGGAAYDRVGDIRPRLLRHPLNYTTNGVLSPEGA